MYKRQDIVLEEVVEEGTAFAQISFAQRTDASDPYTTLTVEIANATSGWRSGPAATRIVSRVPLGDGLERITVRAIPPRSAEARQFFRFRVDYLGFAEAFEDPIR